VGKRSTGLIGDKSGGEKKKKIARVGVSVPGVNVWDKGAESLGFNKD